MPDKIDDVMKILLKDADYQDLAVKSKLARLKLENTTKMIEKKYKDAPPVASMFEKYPELSLKQNAQASTIVFEQHFELFLKPGQALNEDLLKLFKPHSPSLLQENDEKNLSTEQKNYLDSLGYAGEFPSGKIVKMDKDDKKLIAESQENAGNMLERKMDYIEKALKKIALENKEIILNETERKELDQRLNTLERVDGLKEAEPLPPGKYNKNPIRPQDLDPRSQEMKTSPNSAKKGITSF